VAEIHGYPLRPESFEEPLFPTRESRLAVAEHLLEAPWLSRASELSGRGGQAAHACREKIEVERRSDGARLVRRRRCAGSRKNSRRRNRRRCSSWRVVEVLASWREVGGWWEGERAVDRAVHRVLLSDGAVVDLARERGGWFIVGVTD
jgi:hypothetical protein